MNTEMFAYILRDEKDLALPIDENHKSIQGLYREINRYEFLKQRTHNHKMLSWMTMVIKPWMILIPPLENYSLHNDIIIKHCLSCPG